MCLRYESMNKQQVSTFGVEKNMNIPLVFTERHLGKWKQMMEIYIPSTRSLLGAKLISESKSLMSGLCYTENMSNVEYNF